MQVSKKKKQWLLVLTSLILLFIVVAILDELYKRTQGMKAPVVIAELRPVSVVYVAKGNYTATIQTTGEITARNKIDIRSQVSGEIIEVSQQFLPGNRVSKSALLVRIQDSLLQAQLSEARNRMAKARVALLTEQRETDQALRNWRRAGLDGDPDSELVFHQPQLKAVKAEIEAARAAINHAKKELGYSTIRAPFDGIITRRSVSPGEIISAGETLGYLVGNHPLDLVVSLSDRQWQKLPVDREKQQADIKDTGSKKHWPARIRSMGQVMQKQTRLRQIYLELVRPTEIDTATYLLPGSFVEVQLAGRKYENIYRVPASAYTRNARIWTVDSEDTLHPLNVDLLFTDKTYVYIKTPDSEQTAHVIALYPEAGFIAGQKVSPRENSIVMNKEE